MDAAETPRTPTSSSSKLSLADHRKFSDGLANVLLLSPHGGPPPPTASARHAAQPSSREAQPGARPSTARRAAAADEMELLNARLALLSRQFDTAQADLQAAQAALDRYFDHGAKRSALAADSITLIWCQAPGKAWQKACTADSGRGRKRSLHRKITPDVPSETKPSL